MPKKKNILERLKEGPVLGDGGYLLELEKRGWVRAGPFTPEVVLMYPPALRELHTEFREAGAEVLQALTFYASRDKLATVGLENRLEELNRAAVRIAKEVAGDRCLVAGNLSLTWMYEPGNAASADRVRALFDEQLAVQVDEGVDFVIGETFSFLGEALIAVERAKKTGLPAMVTICFENQDITTDGKTNAKYRDIHFLRRRHCGHELSAQSRAHASAHGSDAPGGARLHRLPAGCVSNSAGEARFHQPAGISGPARSFATEPSRDGRICAPGKGNWSELHRRLLWHGGLAHPRDGQGAGQASSRITHLEA